MFASAVPVTPPVRLFQTIQFLKVGLEAPYRTPPPPPESAAVLPENVQLVKLGKEEDEQDIPPPASAELPEKIQLVTMGAEEVAVYIPPPLLLAELPEMMQLVIVGEADT